jgi:hypothetical protein
LAELLRHIEQTSLRQGCAQAENGAPGAAVPAVGSWDLRYFRSTWSRLRVERQLSQSQAQVPDNAGPLNSDRLVMRALQTLRDLSPAYLNGYVAYLDTLMWLDRAQAGVLPTSAKPATPASVARDGQLKTARVKAKPAAKSKNASRVKLDPQPRRQR